MTIYGRQLEIKKLNLILKSNQAEFIAVYGRRRIGKTFLIHEHLQNKGLYFEVTGLKDGSLQEQLFNFQYQIEQTNNIKLDVKRAGWHGMFEAFTKFIEQQNTTKPIILFLDELPWMSTKKGKLIQTLDHFWNTKWSRIKNFKLITCGSAASWMLENLINAKGGLYNRLTQQMLMKPFNLKETQEYLAFRKIKFTQKQILDIFMVTGGVAHYLNHIQKSKSVSQNIYENCFAEDGLLRAEFPRLFKALFDESETNITIVRTIAKHHEGISRDTLIKEAKLSSGGTLAKRLSELEAAGFIQHYIPIDKKNRDSYFRVVDEYSLFYLKWIEPNTKKGQTTFENHWQKLHNSPSWNSWAGYTYETIVLKHIDQVRIALGLKSIGCIAGGWRHKNAQIDLLFDRDDNAVTLCEIKYSNKEFEIDRAYSNNLLNKEKTYQASAANQKQIFMAMISVNGTKENIWYEEFIDSQVVLNDLFQ